MTMEIFSILAGIVPSSLDAAAWLGDAGDLRGELGRPLGTPVVERLDGDAGGLAEHPDSRPGALGLVLVPHELDDLPVPLGELGDAFLGGDQRGHLLSPLGGVGEEPLVVKGDFRSCIGHGGHERLSYRDGRDCAAESVRGRCFPAAGIWLRTPGISWPGSSTCQYSHPKASFPRCFSRDCPPPATPPPPGNRPVTGSVS